MKMLTKEDVGALTADQKLELMDLLSESLEEDHTPVSPEVRDEVEFRLTTYDEDKETLKISITKKPFYIPESEIWKIVETGTDPYVKH